MGARPGKSMDDNFRAGDAASRAGGGEVRLPRGVTEHLWRYGSMLTAPGTENIGELIHRKREETGGN